jgi:hypothetical protein
VVVRIWTTQLVDNHKETGCDQCVDNAVDGLLRIRVSAELPQPVIEGPLLRMLRTCYSGLSLNDIVAPGRSDVIYELVLVELAATTIRQVDHELILSTDPLRAKG